MTSKQTYFVPRALGTTTNVCVCDPSRCCFLVQVRVQLSVGWRSGVTSTATAAVTSVVKCRDLLWGVTRSSSGLFKLGGVGLWVVMGAEFIDVSDVLLSLLTSEET